MGYSMRLELFCVCSLNDFHLVIDLYRGLPLFFLECIYLILLYSSLIFDMLLPLCVCVCVYVSVCVYVCVCVCVHWSGFTFHEQLFFHTWYNSYF